MGVLLRILADVFDPVAVITAIVFLSMAYVVFLPALSEVHAELLLANSVRDAFFYALSALSDPFILAAVLLYSLLSLYVGLVIVAWYVKKRTGKIENPFRRAAEVFPHAIVLGIIVGAPFILAFALYASTYPYLISYVFLALLALVVLYYVPVVSPTIPALVVEGNVKDALHEGVFVGRRWWWKILIYTAIIFAVIWIIAALLAPILARIHWFLAYVFFQTLLYIYTYAVVAEVYIRDAFGE